ncbi:hypothetical protein [Fibrobacter sp. UBA3629]|jgi:membrane protein YdbS with pleckstrin-like domain|uniref:hypothetical protein n=1 Tax=Fibrobacter sp. UBA3629 TaxID=1946530 RepID=UPI0025BE731E|nr:hypothetical protein [Fibrobacter sp. UBA3629]
MESEKKENTQKREFPTIWNTIAICLEFPACCGFLIWIASLILSFFGISDEAIFKYSLPFVILLAGIFILWLIRLTLYHAENATKALNEIRVLREEIKALHEELQKKS